MIYETWSFVVLNIIKHLWIQLTFSTKKKTSSCNGELMLLFLCYTHGIEYYSIYPSFTHSHNKLTLINGEQCIKFKNCTFIIKHFHIKWFLLQFQFIPHIFLFCSFMKRVAFFPRFVIFFLLCYCYSILHRNHFNRHTSWICSHYFLLKNEIQKKLSLSI